jgi:hypothetical protein
MDGPYFDIDEALLSTETSMLSSSFGKHSKPKMQFLLLCAFQMAQNPRQVNQKMQKQREMLVAVFILKLLQLESGNLLNWNEQELDHLYSSLFYCTSEPSLKHMACTSINDLDLRQRLIFEFVKTVVIDKEKTQANWLASSCFFKHADVILLIEKLQQTVETIVRNVSSCKFTDEL